MSAFGRCVSAMMLVGMFGLGWAAVGCYVTEHQSSEAVNSVLTYFLVLFVCFSFFGGGV